MRMEIPIPRERLDEFCRRWKIAELRVFGSALREDFGPDSDLDFALRHAPQATGVACGFWQGQPPRAAAKCSRGGNPHCCCGSPARSCCDWRSARSQVDC